MNNHTKQPDKPREASRPGEKKQSHDKRPRQVQQYKDDPRGDDVRHAPESGEPSEKK